MAGVSGGSLTPGRVLPGGEGRGGGGGGGGAHR